LRQAEIATADRTRNPVAPAFASTIAAGEPRRKEALMLTRNLWHKSLTDEVIFEACERRQTSLDNPGFCLICGNESDGCEPDARNYTCEACGAEQVFGSDELLMEIAL
jgi:hypothetical protein